MVDALSDERINTLLDSALDTQNIIEDVHFDVVTKGKEIDGTVQEYREARILDTSGRPIPNAKWSRGVHQFLHARLNQLAHENKEPENFLIEPERKFDATASARDFLSQYQRIVGLTATAGSPSELAEAELKYSFKGSKIPSHHISQREDKPSLLCSQ